MLLEILGSFACIKALLALFPIHWTNFTNLINPLDCLDQPQRLINRSANPQIIHTVVTDCAARIN